MVIALHIILTGYGHWLPNDPRGSMSNHVWSPKLRELGEPHFGRKAIQPTLEDLKSFHERAEQELKYPLLWFDAGTRRIIAEAFEAVITQNRYLCHACSILSNHAHLVIRKHFHWVETMIDKLKEESAVRVRTERRLNEDHPVWADEARSPFICSKEHLRDAIRYVKANPMKSGLPAQEYPFVVGWGG